MNTPLEPSCSFPYDEIDHNLAEDRGDSIEEAPDLDSVPPEILAGFSAVISLFMDQIAPSADRQIDPRQLGIKLLALLYFASPRSFGETSSMKQLAERAGVSRQAFSTHLLHFAARYGFAHSFQHTTKARGVFKAAQIRAELRRGLLERSAAAIIAEPEAA